jgi:hypothetical protein
MPTLEDAFRLVRLQAPDVPAMLARRFVNATYLDLAARRGWQFLRKETTLQILAARTLTVTFTAGSTAITSAALFVATDQGRQIRVGSGDTFTIRTFTDLSNAILDRAYTGTGGASTAQISDVYLTVPTDFGRFDTIVDPVEPRRLSYWTSQDELNRIDPRRLVSGNPRLLSPRLLTTATGLPTYEWWPRPTSATNLPALYFASPSALADTDSFTGVLMNRVDVVETGALWRAARCPGTKDHPNAYFSMALASSLQAEFEHLANQLDMRDDDVAQQDWATDEQWGRYSAWDFAANLTTLRATDAGIGEYLGGW